ncbi:hypothetical protein [Paraburkholderia sp. HP33-1]|uniref:hypothetical protein n=1 Tax=Paraburkholderia sp. HP33-1 TaxID=2883243 RepID=UPI001F389494|nr:hypothetical protein [Paraburkholderia sp. HP33-1]
MTNERQIGQAMIEEVLSGRHESASKASVSAPAVRATASGARQTVSRTVRCTMLIGVACEVPA